jgi:hypothetical protein
MSLDTSRIPPEVWQEAESIRSLPLFLEWVENIYPSIEDPIRFALLVSARLYRCAVTLSDATWLFQRLSKGHEFQTLIVGAVQRTYQLAAEGKPLKTFAGPGWITHFPPVATEPLPKKSPNNPEEIRRRLLQALAIRYQGGPITLSVRTLGEQMFCCRVTAHQALVNLKADGIVELETTPKGTRVTFIDDTVLLPFMDFKPLVLTEEQLSGWHRIVANHALERRLYYTAPEGPLSLSRSDLEQTLAEPPFPDDQTPPRRGKKSYNLFANLSIRSLYKGVRVIRDASSLLFWLDMGQIRRHIPPGGTGTERFDHVRILHRRN